MNNKAQAGYAYRWLIAVGLSVLWIFIVYAAYYTVHKPFNTLIVLAVLDRAADLAVCAAMLLVATAIGGRALRVDLAAAALEELLFSAGLGLGMVSLGTLALGLLGLLNHWLFWALLVALVAFNGRSIKALVARFRPRRGSRVSSQFAIFLLVFLCVTLLLALVSALTPPAAWDALVYHLEGPKTYIGVGRVVWVPDNFHLSFPALTEMLFLCGMLLKGDIVPHLLHLAFGALTVAAVYAFSRKHFGGHVPLLAAALFAAIPTAVTVAAWAYVDLALAFYSFLAFFAIVNWLDDRSTLRWLLVAGALCGMALSIKYTGFTALAVVVTLALLGTMRAKSARGRSFAAILVMVVVALVVGSPWYLKSLVCTGNPIYPYVFGGRGWNELRNAWLSSIGVSVSPLQLLFLPWDITVLGTQGTTAFDATISPYFLALLPLVVVVPREHRMLLPLALFALITYVLWIAAGAVTYSTFVFRTRILLPCFVPLSVLAAYVVDALKKLDRRQFSLQRFVLLALGLGLAVNLVTQGLSFLALDPLRFIMGAESRDDFLDRQLADGHYEVIQFINTALPSMSKTLFFWEPRSYYCQRDCLPDVVFDHFSQLAAESPDANHIADALRNDGISHVLVNERWLAMSDHDGLFTSTQRQLLGQLLEDHLQRVYVQEGLYSVYALE